MVTILNDVMYANYAIFISYPAHHPHIVGIPYRSVNKNHKISLITLMIPIIIIILLCNQ